MTDASENTIPKLGCTCLGVLLFKAAGLAAATVVVVWVLRWMGVL